MDETVQDDWRLAPPGYAYAPAPVVAELPRGARYGLTAHLARPLTGLGWTTGVLLALHAALALAAAAAAGWMVLSYAGTSGNDLDALVTAAPLRIYVVLQLAGGALSIVTGVFFVSWLFRACRNAQLYGVRLRRSPGWAIGSWLVPVISLWWPKQVVDDVLRGSAPDVPAGSDVRHLRRSGYITAWWTCWLSASLLAQAPSVFVLSEVRALFKDAAPGADLMGVLSGLDLARLLESSSLWLLGASVAMCAAATFAVVVVAEVTGSQRERRRALEALWRA